MGTRTRGNGRRTLLARRVRLDRLRCVAAERAPIGRRTGIEEHRTWEACG